MGGHMGGGGGSGAAGGGGFGHAIGFGSFSSEGGVNSRSLTSNMTGM
jgi:hypothetical protein